MAKAFIDDTHLTDIADAIRATLDESRQYLPSEMAAAIDSIPVMAQLNRKKYFQAVPSGAASGYATIEKIEGNTVVWNQLVDTGSTSVVVQSGHVYYANINGTASIATSDGTPISVTGGTDIIHDLTAIFGLGNEPTTVAEFEAWLAQNGLPSVADYNAGELLSVKMSGMQTEDSSQQTVDTIALDVTTITGINTATNVREVIFADGMKQADYAGTVKDTLDLLSDKATVKCGIVDLGDVDSWTYQGAYQRFRCNIPILGYIDADSVVLQCAKYNPTSWNAMQDRPDKSCCIYVSGSNHYFYIIDSALSSSDIVDGSIANLQGVKIIFMLDTPITYTDLQDQYGNPLNPRYKVEQGGTEQVLPANTSTPTTVAPTLSTIYKKNA